MNLKVDAEGHVFGVEPRDFPVNKGAHVPQGRGRLPADQPPATAHLPDDAARAARAARWSAAPGTRRWTLSCAASATIQAAHGQNAVAIYSGSSMTTEKSYLMGKFARVAVGTGNIDYNGRLCMVARGGGNNKAFGVDRAANPWSDIALADVIFAAGTNTAECHPLTMPYIWEARDRGGKHHRGRPARHPDRPHRRHPPADPARHRYRPGERHPARR